MHSLIDTMCLTDYFASAMLVNNERPLIIMKQLLFSADDVHMDKQLPCGNIGQGLAWMYFYGYLNLIFQSKYTTVSI